MTADSKQERNQDWREEGESIALLGARVESCVLLQHGRGRDHHGDKEPHV